jgi:Flp pilus assembly protein TadG
MTAVASRKGAALVELAVSLPILLLLTFGSIEATNALVLKQTLTETAYETARMATNQGETEADALVRAEEILTSRSVEDAVITITPNVTATTPAGTEITVTISAPASSNSIGPHWYYKGSTLSATVVMVRM